ncbi:MAG: hypothetical protein ACKVII_08095 [Planctomycetales bacterium]
MSICQYTLHAEGHPHRRPNNRSMSHNRYGHPTLDDETAALLQ